MHTRAERRFKKTLMKKKAKEVYPWMSEAVKLADHLKSCSCLMCGNPRKWWKEPSLSERRFKSISIDTE
jgi:hypothetical protein